MYFTDPACYGRAMSTSCARPECNNSAVSWYVALPGRQVVEVFMVEQELAVALCQTHFARFTVPDGWHIRQPDVGSRRAPSQGEPLLQTVPELPPEIQDTGEPMSDDAMPIDNRLLAEKLRTRRPWFVAETDQLSESHASTDQRTVKPRSNGSVSGLLDRAFNGPQSRGNVVGVSDELEERRSARRAETDQVASPPVAPTVVDYETHELPFPPSDADVTVFGS